MKNKLLWISILIIIYSILIIGCTSNITVFSTENEFVYEYTFDDIEWKDKKNVEKWINDKEVTPVKLYEVYDETNNRHFEYLYSEKFNDAIIEQEGKSIIVTVLNSNELKRDYLLLKIKYNPDIIDTIVLKEK